MERFVDILSATGFILLALLVIIAAFYFFTIVVPIAMIAFAIYVISKIIEEDRKT